jgi:hypothetical protein
VDDGFGVAVGVEGVTQFFELFPQLEIVVDLAVEDYPGTAISIVNGLLTAFEVDNCEATHRQTHRAVDVEAILVRPAVTNGVIHPRQQFLVNWFSVVSNDAYDSTHLVTGDVY